VCNGKDDNCSGTVDDVASMPKVYQDADGDGYGCPSKSKNSCFIENGWVSNADDCNDDDANVNPDATEVCNGKDDNCSGTVDDVSAD